MRYEFFLGTHKAHWLRLSEVPLFVSHRSLVRRETLPKAKTRWALDSGGFSELSMFGKWTIKPADYVEAVYSYKEEIGKLVWAAPQDWMCEPAMLERTGLSIDRHQGLTVENYMLLRSHAPDLPWIPVLQGWEIDDYLICASRYYEAGVDVGELPVVGVGSVCRRQHTGEVAKLLNELKLAGISCHGFGVKTLGLAMYGKDMVSSDSMAWSFHARMRPPLPDCTHRNCANCIRYALLWRERLLTKLGPVLGTAP